MLIPQYNQELQALTEPLIDDRISFIQLSSRRDEHTLNKMCGQSLEKFHYLSTRQLQSNNSKTIKFIPNTHRDQSQYTKHPQSTQDPITKFTFQNTNKLNQLQKQSSYWFQQYYTKKVIVKPLDLKTQEIVKTIPIINIPKNLIRIKEVTIKTTPEYTFKVGDKPDNINDYLSNLKHSINVQTKLQEMRNQEQKKPEQKKVIFTTVKKSVKLLCIDKKQVKV